MTIHRTLAGQIDDDRTCVVPDCDMPALAEPHQLDDRPATLRDEAERLRAKAAELESQAKAIKVANTKARVHPFLCGAHRAHLPRDLAPMWQAVPIAVAGIDIPGRLVVAPADEADVIAATLAAIPAPAVVSGPLASV